MNPDFISVGGTIAIKLQSFLRNTQQLLDLQFQ